MTFPIAIKWRALALGVFGLAAQVMAQVTSPIEAMELDETSEVDVAVRERPKDAVGDAIFLGESITLREASPRPHRVGIRARAFFNVGLHFEENSEGPDLPDDSIPGGEREYIDGTVAANDSGSRIPGFTSNFSFNSSEQVDFRGGSPPLLNFSTYGPIDNLGNKTEFTQQAGFEIFYAYEIVRFETVETGARLSLGYLRIDERTDQDAEGEVEVIQDSYLATANILTDPSNGDATRDPGEALITEGVFDRDTEVRDAKITGWQEVQADVFTLAFGPYVEYSDLEPFFFSFDAGFHLSFATIDFEFEERLEIDGLEISDKFAERSGEGSGADVAFGYYGEVAAGWEFVENWSLLASYRYIGGGALSTEAGTRTVNIEIGDTHAVGAGVQFRF